MFCSCYDHQTGEETGLRGDCDALDVIRRVDFRGVTQTSGIVPSFIYVLFDDLGQGHSALLLPDQIKPIEQLVPVS